MLNTFTGDAIYDVTGERPFGSGDDLSSGKMTKTLQLDRGLLRKLVDLLAALAPFAPNDTPRGALRRSNSPDDRKDEKNEEDQSNSSKRIISPTGAVGPGRKGADQKKNQNDEENSTHESEIMDFAGALQSFFF